MRRIVEGIKALGFVAMLRTVAILRTYERRSNRSRDRQPATGRFGVNLTRTMRDPAAATWQGKLADQFEQEGDRLLDGGLFAQAMDAYRRFHAIAEELAERNLESCDRRLALVVSNWKLAALGEFSEGRFMEVVNHLHALKNTNQLLANELCWLPEAEKELALLQERHFSWNRSAEETFNPALRIHSENPF